MSFWTSLEADINKGLEVASVVVGLFAPSYATILTDVAEVVADIENVFGTASTTTESSPLPVTTTALAKKATTKQPNMSAVVQAATVMSVVRQFNAKMKQ